MKTSSVWAMSFSLPVIIAAAFVTPAQAQGTAEQTFINPKEIKWGDAPPFLPRGAKIAVLHGDPGKAGPFNLRLMTPAGYKIPPHWHSQDENLTIISGALYLGMGDKMEPAKAQPLTAGGYHFLQGKAQHYAFTKAPTVIQIESEGPFDINYINPADNPQKK